MASSIPACFFAVVTHKPHSLRRCPKPLEAFQFRHVAHPPSLILHQSTRLRCRKTAASVIRSSIWPGGNAETDKLPSHLRKRAMEAIDSNRRRVTVGDVAIRAGLNLNEAQNALQALAADANGLLEVSDEGDIIYVFPKDYRSKLVAKAFWIKIDFLLEKGKMAAENWVMATFLTILITSILTATPICCIFGLIIIALSNGDPERYPFRAINVQLPSVESALSFVFGDHDPSKGIEEKRWKMIGKYIASNGGVVTAEELAPYLDLETSEKMGDDSYILPVLLRLDGHPEVDEEGNILLCFPSLQRTATPQRSRRKEYTGRRANSIHGVAKFFNEKKLQFSKICVSDQKSSIVVGILNLIGVIANSAILGRITNIPRVFISLLQIHAVSFFAVPLIRWWFIQRTNAKIVERNRARKQRATALKSPDPSMRQKLSSARNMAQRIFVGKDKIVFSSKEDSYVHAYETQDWDRRFNEIEMSL